MPTDPKRAVEIRTIVEHFNNAGEKTVSNEALIEYCTRVGYAPITSTEYEDYAVQLMYDKRLSEMVPKIMQLFVEHYRYQPVLASETELKKCEDGRMEVQMGIVKLIEEYEIPFYLADAVTRELSSMVSELISRAGTACTNKGTQVLMHLATREFGEQFHMGHVAKYASDVIHQAFADKEKNEKATTL